MITLTFTIDIHRAEKECPGSIIYIIVDLSVLHSMWDADYSAVLKSA